MYYHFNLSSHLPALWHQKVTLESCKDVIGNFYPYFSSLRMVSCLQMKKELVNLSWKSQTLKSSTKFSTTRILLFQMCGVLQFQITWDQFSWKRAMGEDLLDTSLKESCMLHSGLAMVAWYESWCSQVLQELSRMCIKKGARKSKVSSAVAYPCWRTFPYTGCRCPAVTSFPQRESICHCLCCKMARSLCHSRPNSWDNSTTTCWASHCPAWSSRISSFWSWTQFSVVIDSRSMQVGWNCENKRIRIPPSLWRLSGEIQQYPDQYGVKVCWKIWKRLDHHLPYLLFAYRVAIQHSTQAPSFYLLYGREPRTPTEMALSQPRTVYQVDFPDHCADGAGCQPFWCLGPCLWKYC